MKGRGELRFLNKLESLISQYFLIWSLGDTVIRISTGVWGNMTPSMSSTTYHNLITPVNFLSLARQDFGLHPVLPFPSCILRVL